MVLRGPLRGRVGRRRTQCGRGSFGSPNDPRFLVDRPDRPTGGTSWPASRVAMTGRLAGHPGTGPPLHPAASLPVPGTAAEAVARRPVAGRAAEAVASPRRGRRPSSTSPRRGQGGRGGQSAGSESSRRKPSIRTQGERDRQPTGRRSDSDGAAPPAGRTARAGGTQDSQSAARNEPAIPDGATIHLLDREVRADLRSLSKPTAEIVGAHLAAAGQHLEDDPVRALEHARAARARAGRIGVVREAVGIAAYRAQQWAEALSELRAARRITGDPRNLAVIADTERALGRPAQALRLLDDPDVARLDGETRAELLIVVAGARRDLGQMDAALGVLARGGLDTQRPRPGSMRLWYAYADALQAAGRLDDAARWFAASAALDPAGETDAAERAAALL